MQSQFTRPCVIARARFDQSLLSSRLDARTYLALEPHFERLTLVAQSRDARLYRERHGGLDVFLLPFVPGPVGAAAFVAAATALALALRASGRASHFLASDPFTAGIVASLAARVGGCPVVMMAQGEVLSLPEERFSRVERWAGERVAAWLCRHADRVRAVSERIRDQLVAAGVRADRVHVVPPRVDVDEFDAASFAAGRAAARAALGYGPEDVVAIMVGTLNASKSVSTAIEALAAISTRRPRARLLLVGDGPLRAELRRQAERAGVADLVRFHGRVPHDQVPALLSLADVYLLTSVDEGLPRATLEAMAMSLPVVVTAVGGNPDVVEDGVTGRLVPPRDPAAVAAAWEAIVSRPEEAAAMGRAARTLIVERYAFELQMQKLVREVFLMQ